MSTGAGARRTWRRATALGTAAGLVVCAWLATFGSFDLFEWRWSSDFYDAQAHAWIDGTWEIGIDTLGLEAFYRFDDDAVRYLDEEWRQSIDLLGVEEFFREQPAYMYQGPAPAVLHLPFAAVTDRLDGRLAVLSILVAAGIVGWTAGRIGWELRAAIRPERQMSRTEAALAGLVSFAIVGGSILTYLASRSWVYHEALMWGVAFCLLSVLAMIRYIRAPSWWRMAGMGAATVAAVLTRASIGVGPLVAMALLAAVMVAGHLSTARLARVRAACRRVAPAVDGVARHVAALWGWCAAAVGGYAAVNAVKFGSAFSVPFEWQYFALIDEQRSDFLTETGGYFSASFVPTTVAHYLRPDGLRVDGLFPWVDFPPVPGPMLGGVDFDFVDRTSSIPTTMFVFVALAIVAVVVVLRRRPVRAALAPITIPLLATVGAALTILPFGYISNRYIADAAPLVILLGTIGLQATLVILDERPGWVRRGVTAAVAAAAVVGLWVNVGQGLLVQRIFTPVDDEEDTAQLIEWQDALDRLLGSGDAVPTRVSRRATLPPGDAGDLVVIGDCEALYLNDGNPQDALRAMSWIPVQRSTAAGRQPLTLVLEAGLAGTTVPLASAVGPAGPTLIALEVLDDDQAIVHFSSPTFLSTSAPVDLPAAREVDVVLAADPNLGVLTLDVDGVQVFTTFYDQPGPLEFGRDVTGSPGVRDVLAGSIELGPGADMDLCRDLVGRAALDQSAAGSGVSSNRYW